MAKVSEQEASRLGADLTPVGAEQAGSADGWVPAWNGGIKHPPEGYTPGDFLQDPFEDEAPLDVIDQGKADKYKGLLSEGYVRLLDKYPESFRIHLFKSHRTHAAPQWVYDNTRRNATLTELSANGAGLVNAFGGVPFPIPNNGLEVVWNHVTRWRGVLLRREEAEAVVYPNGSRKMVVADLEVSFNYYKQRSDPNDIDNILLYYISVIKSPPRLAGGAFLLIDTLNQLERARQSWGYNTGQRRVRRLPHVSYDSPALLSESSRTTDDTDMFNGAPDRFTWTLKGKRKLIVPYNTNRLGLPSLDYDTLLTPYHINQEHVRHEVHRVWVVEGRLKQDARHVYSKRVFYIDEDSWSILIAENYDQNGALWRVNVSHGWAVTNGPGVMPVVDVYHDLKTGLYNAKGMQNQAKVPGQFEDQVRSAEYYTPAVLRKLGRR